MAKPYVLPGSGTTTKEVCKYCWEEREREEILNKHVDAIITADDDLISEDDYNHYWTNYTRATVWYCEYCEEIKEEDGVHTLDTRVWVCPECGGQWGDQNDAASCC